MKQYMIHTVTPMSAKREALRRKSWFLTYPRADSIDKKSILTFLLSTFNVSEYVIAEETHKEGEKHYHVFVLLKKKVRFKATLFDIEGLHGNYQPVKNKKNVIKYICKEDKNPLTNLNLDAIEKKKNKLLLKEDYLKDPISLLDEGKINFFQIFSFLQNQNLYKLYSKKEEINLKIEKKRHRWYWGGSNTGKTYLLKSKQKEEKSNWFQIPLNNDWNGYNGEVNLYADEFKGQLSVQELNRICDGGAKVNTKGSTICLRQDVIVWIFSNYEITSCYKNCDSFIIETLYNRFVVTEMVRFCANNITSAKTDRGPGT